MSDYKAIVALANAEAQHQMTRPFARRMESWTNGAQRDSIRAMIVSAVVAGIEMWELGHPSRERDKFYAGK